MDIQFARRSGLSCISVDWGYRSHSFLVQSGGDPIVSDIPSLMQELIRS